MDLEEGVAGVDGQLLDLGPVLGVGVVPVPVRPQPQLGVGVEAVAKHWNGIKSLHKVSDVSHLHLFQNQYEKDEIAKKIAKVLNALQFHLREGFGSAVGLHAPVMANSALPVVETFVEFFATLESIYSTIPSWSVGKLSKHLKGHSAPRVSNVTFWVRGHSVEPVSNVTFLGQRSFCGTRE